MVKRINQCKLEIAQEFTAKITGIESNHKNLSSKRTEVLESSERIKQLVLAANQDISESTVVEDSFCKGLTKKANYPMIMERVPQETTIPSPESSPKKCIRRLTNPLDGILNRSPFLRASGEYKLTVDKTNATPTVSPQVKVLDAAKERVNAALNLKNIKTMLGRESNAANTSTMTAKKEVTCKKVPLEYILTEDTCTKVQPETSMDLTTCLGNDNPIIDDRRSNLLAQSRKKSSNSQDPTRYLISSERDKIGHSNQDLSTISSSKHTSKGISSISAGYIHDIKSMPVSLKEVRGNQYDAPTKTTELDRFDYLDSLTCQLYNPAYQGPVRRIPPPCPGDFGEVSPNVYHPEQASDSHKRHTYASGSITARSLAY